MAMNTTFERDKTFIGQGLAFPMQVNSRGELALVTGTTDIDQSIGVILARFRASA